MVYLVVWDIDPNKAGGTALKRFQRLVRRLLDSGRVWKVQRSLLATDDKEAAWAVYQAAAGLGDVRIYRAEAVVK